MLISTGEKPIHHILSVVVENKSGVLTRVAGLFARRGFNIFSLAVAPTDDKRFSRIVVVVDAESAPVEQMVRQLDKLINVIEISELAPADSLERELLLVTVESSGGLEAVVAQAGGQIVQENDEQAIISFTGSPDQVDAFIEVLQSFGIVALQRTGRVALPRLV